MTPDIETLMGIAVGRIGMNREDFERCTPLELSRIAKAHGDEVEMFMRSGWERTRTEVVGLHQLFSKRTLDPKRVFPLPWDNEGYKDVPKGTSSPERMKKVAERLMKTG